MNISRPTLKQFDYTKYQNLIEELKENILGLEFERSLEVVAYDILENYEGFKKVEKGPNFRGTPFDFFGFKNRAPFIIEFKGSLKRFNTPGETQKHRMKKLLTLVKGLNLALLQVKLRKGEYRIYYNEEMEILFQKREAPLKPIEDWINRRIK
ncbi:hypothetical protein KAX35_00640 [candidate division WOR-3 bacterium]|nr:hypothetical protein [candidate division WOR-3 bacterium]